MCLPIYSADSFIENEYDGKLLSKVTRILGKEYEEEYFTFSKNYLFSSEMEPDYSLYLEKNEIDNGVIICKRFWKKSNRTIVIWAKKNKRGKWIVFNSINFDNSIKF